MPATEQTWRNTKLLHVVFGLTGLAMLGSTIWMLAADHDREWKGYQREFRELETWVTDSRIDEQRSTEYVNRRRELESQVQATTAEPPPLDLVGAFVQTARPLAEVNGYNVVAVESAAAAVDLAAKRMDDASDDSAKQAATTELVRRRRELLAAMNAVVDRARYIEDAASRKLKFRRADLDVERSKYSLAVDQGLSDIQLEPYEQAIKHVEEGEGGVHELNLAAQNARSHREALERIVAHVTANEAAAKKALADLELSVERLETQRKEVASNFGKTLLEMPILDAFMSPLRVDQVWLPELTLFNNFRKVARFDRCTTCHKGIQKTAPGSAVEPSYEAAHEVKVTLHSPSTAPEMPESAGASGSLQSANERLHAAYGFTLAERGFFDPDDITIDVVRPLTPAADAGLFTGDVIVRVFDVNVLGRAVVLDYLLDRIEWGQPVELVVRRGVPQPYSTHPRMDLFVGSMSPHKMGDVGCTICHEGQGSATAFKWASHTPNDPRQEHQWKEEHGWFHNHHWIFPMLPNRFEESSCLKCHHDLTELEPSPRFPDPPAPKVMAGFHLIREYGCFGCHEINGFDSPTKRRGPDVRVEPQFFAAAQQLLVDPGLSDQERRLASDVVAHPEYAEPRMRLAEMLRADAGTSEGTPRLRSSSHALAVILGADEETPAGQYRKVGPSLRHVASKVDFEFLYNWIREPKDFRPSTKMPQFFGLYDHLVPDETEDAEHHKVYVESQGLKDSKRFEPIEVRAVAEYLLSSSQPFEYLDRPAGVTADPSAERGKAQFETRGCLACHKHSDYPQVVSDFGPDLSRLGSKLTGETGARWLYSWVRAPNRYHARTVMPILFLDPITHEDGSVTDPAADITAYLLGSQGWTPKPVPEYSATDLDDLAKMYLAAAFTAQEVDQIIEHGIPESQAADLKGDERVLISDGELTEQKKLLYVGKRTISRLGCAACHDIPGYEEAKPIGTGLADWGRKETSKLAFEQIVPYLTLKLNDALPSLDQAGHAPDAHELHTEHLHLDPDSMNPDTGFFVEAILNHQREGFLWQKLREPRSYDYKKTESKPYIDRLRMPLFPFDEAQREAVMTFVLGLVSEPPADRYVYHPEPRQKAVLDGKRLLTKYNCTACHTLQMETWQFDYRPDELPPPPPWNDYAFLQAHFTPEQLEASKQVDRRGLGHATVTGMPNPQVGEDDDGNPLYYFGLWEPVAINGHGWNVGDPELPIPEAAITAKRPPNGGDFARFLHPIVLANERVVNPNAKDSDAWGWVPPPLIGEGIKVQTAWVHDFLLDPYPIRPAVVLRMPRFNMSSDEAAKIANHFAAVDGVDFPYDFSARSRLAYNDSSAASGETARLDDALRLVTDNNYCVKCHLVGDYTPPGSVAALAPQLGRVSHRLRPDFMEKWLANPRRLLPYTGMPVNFQIDKPVDQNLIPGTSEEQLQTVVDLLLNYDALMKERTSIKPMVKPVTLPAAEAAPADGSPTAAAANGDEVFDDVDVSNGATASGN